MSDSIDQLRRQSEWQKSRARLSWYEKLIMAEALRDAALVMQRKSEDERLPHHDISHAKR